MSFYCKIILSGYSRADKSKRVYLQAIIDRKRAIVPLGFYLKQEAFDQRRQCIKPGLPNKESFDTEFQVAITKGNSIASKFRLEGKYLTPGVFREEFKNPTEAVDFIRFITEELELKRPKIAHNTYKQHNTVINKLKEFRKVIPFGMISIELIQQFQNQLIKTNAGPTVHKVLKIVKQYLTDARIKGFAFKDPFVAIKIKNFKSNRMALSDAELLKVEAYYDKADCLPKHKKLLQYFLFSCYTGLRISDITAITWTKLHDNLLIFRPEKTKYSHNDVTVPLSAKARKYLPPFPPTKNWSGKIFPTYSDPVSNRYLKDVADKLEIRKKITYHTSRHTFGSLFAEGGNIVALQKIMGHGDIKTTMGYVHTSTKNLVDATKERFGE